MTINCNGTLVDLSEPKVMGILNVTPDSFYDGGKHSTETAILKHTEQLLSEGATFIDIGGYSTRPDAKDISIAEEKQRVLPIVQSLLKAFPEIMLSIDTFRSDVAKECLEAGAAMINDISAGTLDTAMIATVAQYRVPYVMMHMRGNPQKMKSQTMYQNLWKEILFYFSEKIQLAKEAGIRDIVIDPGFGFSKNSDQNFELLKELELLKHLKLPILAGISRKSMIYNTLKTSSENSLNGTSVLNTIALLRGASILRVHDVKQAMECITLTNQSV